MWGGALATAGGVVFYGTLDGWFKAVDARTGKVLWQFKVGSGVVGNPVTYTGPDGKQYVAIYAGIGGDMGLLIAGDVAANLPYDVRERGTTLPDLARWTSWGGELFVFSSMRFMRRLRMVRMPVARHDRGFGLRFAYAKCSRGNIRTRHRRSKPRRLSSRQ